jgi:putative chitinase
MPDIVGPVADALEARAAEFGVETPWRIAHFIAQICHESAGFTKLVEDLNYSASRIAEVWPRLKARAAELAHKPEALANAAYGNRMGNGPEESGDGHRYSGRGLIQITGRDNYRDRAVSLRMNLIGEPQLCAEPGTAALVALSFWRARGCNQAADTDSVEAVTRLINGPALQDIERRRELTQRAKVIFVKDADERLIA